MRRSDREITDKNRIEKFIAKEQILRVAFHDNGDIYIVPVNYGYLFENDKYLFYFHGAKEGRKYELSKSEPKVGFEIDGEYRLLESENACSFSECNWYRCPSSCGRQGRKEERTECNYEAVYK